MNNKTYCPMPFVTLSVNPGNYISRCMMSMTPMGDISTKTYQNKKFKKLRLDMLNGVWDEKGCSSCFIKEQSGLTSQRQKWLNNEEKYLGKQGIYENNLDIKTNNIHHIYLNFSNICNFKCRMCGPHFSNAWIPDAKKLNDKGFVVGNEEIPPKSQVDVNKFFDEFGSRLGNLSQIWITGGEPFIDDSIYSFFKKLEIYTDVKKIKVSINTNGSKLDIKKLQELSHLKNLTLNFSVDATGDLYTYMRGYQYSFDQIHEKIDQCIKLQKTQANLNIAVNGTYQIYNILNIKDFWKWGKTIANSKLGNWIEYRTLLGPKYLQARHAPVDIKNQAIKMAEELIESDPYYSHNHYLNQVIQECKQNSEDTQIEKFLKWNQTLDNIRNEDLNNYCSFLYDGWKKEGII